MLSLKHDLYFVPDIVERQLIINKTPEEIFQSRYVYVWFLDVV